MHFFLCLTLLFGLCLSACDRYTPAPKPEPSEEKVARATNSLPSWFESLSEASRAAPSRWRPPVRTYGLDGESRFVEPVKKGRPPCPDLPLESYKGSSLKYAKPLKIYPEFKTVLGKFEDTVKAVALEVYGREPWRLRHFGSYNCRTVRRRPYLLSEHALGNAVDISGFEFKALPKKERKGLGRVGRAFTVSVEKHWEGEKGFEAKHSEFLKKLVQRLREDDIFRGVIVPPAPGHLNHFHLDMGRWSYLRGDPWSLPEPEPGEES